MMVMPTDDLILELSALTKTYGGTDALQPRTVLDGIDLEVRPGESIAVTGPSGSGKSTLLNIMGTLDRATSGRVLIGGRDVSSCNEHQLTRLRRTRIGFVFQDHHLLAQCTAWENVLVPTLAWPDRVERRQAQDLARDLLERVGLSDHLDHRPGELSGGQCQRVAVVRALLHRPALLLADEPTGSLDRRSADDLAQLLVELSTQHGAALVVATHAADLVRRMSRKLELRDGRLGSGV